MQAYQEIARKLKLSGHEDPQADPCRLVLDWLEEEVEEEWLMIWDNADDGDLFLRDMVAERDGSGLPASDRLPPKTAR